jgi:hypothetical protein
MTIEIGAYNTATGNYASIKISMFLRPYRQMDGDCKKKAIESLIFRLALLKIVPASLMWGQFIF